MPRTPNRSKKTSVLCLGLAGVWGLSTAGQCQTLYNFGNPSGEEQLYLQLINRARANPPAEGARLAATTDPVVLAAYAHYKVNLTMMQNEFNAIAAQPPLAPNGILNTIARSHSAWMLATGTEAHEETNPYNTPWSRMTGAGYYYNDAGESIYGLSNSVWHGHAAFQVDWGEGGTGGMQPGRGHRENTHSAAFREIGVGVVNGNNGNVGPQLVTQDFGVRNSSKSFGTGVAYYDLNSNNFYDIGEGISGLTVNVEGSSHYCTTAIGGGWALPVPTTAATRTVTFSGLGVNHSASVAFPASNNAKADLKLTYTPPAITTPATAYHGVPHTVAFTGTAGATAHRWKRWNFASALAENCESTAGITTSTTGNYSVRSTTVKQQGTSSFHLECTNGINQSIELNGTYFGNATPSLSFQSRVRSATTTQFFRVQVREEGTTIWRNVYSQAGSGTAGESTFNLRTAPLSAMTGKAFRVRFLFDQSGGWYPNSGDTVGWFIDAITFTNVSSLINPVSELLTGNSGSFTPLPQTYLTSVAPVISASDFPASYQTLTVTDPPPPPSFENWASALETAHSLPVGSLANPNGDFDLDGRPNLIEYAFGTSPVSAGDPPAVLPTGGADATHFTLHYRRDTSLVDLTYTPEACQVLNDWKPLGDPGAPAGFTDTLISTDGTIETRQARIPLSSAACFLRMRISKP